MTWILLVTWIIPGNPGAASSYQTQFHSQQTCEAARTEVINSAEQMRQQRISSAGNNHDLQIVMTMGAPQVSAVCSAQ